MNAAIINDINYCKYCLPSQAVTTTTVVAGPTRVSATQGAYFRRATVLGKKALDGTVNAGAVNVGYSGTASQQPFVLASNDEVVLEAPVGAKHDLYDLYFTVASDGDGVVVLYS